MQLPFFFTDTIGQQTILNLPEDTARHCVQVMRMKSGDMLQLTNGKGSVYTATIKEAGKKSCTVFIKDVVFYEPPAKKLSVAISLLKNANRFEWFLEKATEIGVTEIIPLICQRTERQHFRFDRMNNILVSAMLQSRQSWLPILQNPAQPDQVVTGSSYQYKLIAHCEPEIKNDVLDFSKFNNIQILIGPEGDFTPLEIGQAIQNGYLPVSIGHTRLRTETAGVVAAALLKIPSLSV